MFFEAVLLGLLLLYLKQVILSTQRTTMENSFGKNIIPLNEKERLAALHRYQILKDLPQGYFSNLAQIVARTFDTPIALVSLVDEKSVLFPGNVGMEGIPAAPRGISLCSLAVLDDHPTVFEDALEEPCLLTNPLVTGNFGLRFYAGAPITTPDGYAIGTVCVVDKEPRAFNEKDRELLQYFATVAMQDIEHRIQTLNVKVTGGEKTRAEVKAASRI